MHIGPQQRRCGSFWSKTKKDDTLATRCGAMDGDGLFTSRMHPTNRLQLTTKRTASAVMSLQRAQIGSTFKAIRFSRRQSEQRRVIKVTSKTYQRSFGDEEVCAEKVSLRIRPRCSLHGLCQLTPN